MKTRKWSEWSALANPTVSTLVGENVAEKQKTEDYAKKKWVDRKKKAYHKVIPTVQKDNYAPSVETSYSVTNEVATEVQLDVALEIECEVELNEEYTNLNLTNPVFGNKLSSEAVNMSQLLYRFNAGVTENISLNTKKDTYDASGSFDAAAHLVVPDKEKLNERQSYKAYDSNKKFIYVETPVNLDVIKDKLNRLLSFNNSLYVQYGKMQDERSVIEFREKWFNEPHNKFEIIPRDFKQQRDIAYINSTSPVSQFEAPLMPVMTENAFSKLKENEWLYDPGFDLDILPLGFLLVSVQGIYPNYDLEYIKYRAILPNESRRITVKYSTIDRNTIVLDWNEEQYKIQKENRDKNLQEPDSEENYIKALLTSDYAEFSGECAGRDKEALESLKQCLQNHNAQYDGDDFRVKTFLQYCELIKKYDAEFYSYIEKTFEIASSHLLTIETVEYLSKLSETVILSSIDTSAAEDELKNKVMISKEKLLFIKATFLSMDKSNFIQISRALDAFFIRFDKMTDFNDIKAKQKFYKLLIERTVNNGKLCLKGAKGYAQMELFKLLKLLDKAASFGTEFLELQLELIRSKDPETDLFNDETDISFAAGGDCRVHQKAGILKGMPHDQFVIEDSGFAIVDPLMQLPLSNSKLEEESPFGNEENVNILSWISRKLASQAALFGSQNNEERIAVYKKIRETYIYIEKIQINLEYSPGSRKIPPMESFTNLCKLYVNNSMLIEASSFYEFSQWLVKLNENKHIPKMAVPRVTLEGSPITQSEQFKGAYYDKYVEKHSTYDVVYVLSPHSYPDAFDALLFNINRTCIGFLGKTKGIRLSIDARFYTDATCLLVHNKQITTYEQDTGQIEADLLRYKKVWNISSAVKAHIISGNPTSYGDSTLLNLFCAMHNKLNNAAISDPGIKDVTAAKKAHSIYKCHKPKNIEPYKQAIIDSRFLTIHALCIDAPSTLDPENDFEDVIDWVNKWIDDCDTSLRGGSVFDKVRYDNFVSKVCGIRSYKDLAEAMTSLFPDMKQLTGSCGFSLKNVMKGPRVVNIGSSQNSEELDKVFEPEDFFAKLEELIRNNGLSSSREDIVYNSIFKLFKYKISRVQIAKVKNGTVQNIDFKEAGKLDQYAKIIMQAYMQLYPDVDTQNISKQMGEYIDFALPILEEADCDPNILLFFEPFREIYGQSLRGFLGKIQSYGNILRDATREKFGDDTQRETSSDNFYRILAETTKLWRPKKHSEKFFHEFHRYLDNILDFGVFSQELTGHHFSAIMTTALGLLAGCKPKKSDTEDLKQIFDRNHSGSAVNVFYILTEIATRRNDCLLFEYLGASVGIFQSKKCFEAFVELLQSDSEGLEELAYNLHATKMSYEDRFKAFSQVLSQAGSDLRFKVSIINCLLSSRSTILSIADLHDLLKKLSHLKIEDFLLLERYLMTISNEVLTKEKLDELFSGNKFNAGLCEQRLAEALEGLRYSFDKESVTKKFSEIQGVDVEELLADYEKVFEHLSDLRTKSNTQFQGELGIINKDDDLLLAAYVIDGARRVYGILIKPIQIAVTLTTIRSNGNLFHKVKTGQGKTFIISIIASFYALQNIKVDISTDTFELASRDAKEMFLLYNFLGIPSSVNAITANGTTVSEYVKAMVSYGTLGAINLFKNTAIQKGLTIPKARTMLLSDEFDADRDNKTLFRLSRTPEFTNIENPTLALRLMLEEMLSFVDDEKLSDDSNVFKYGEKNEKRQIQDLENFKEFIERKLKQAEERGNIKTLANLEKVHAIIEHVGHEHMALLLASCHTSKNILENWKIGRQYNEVPRYKLIRSYKGYEDRIVLINGILPIIAGKFNLTNWASKFSDGIQQFLAIRKNRALALGINIYYDVEPLTSTSAVSSPQNLIFGRESGDYFRVIGFSGTGGNKAEVERMENTLNMKSVSYPLNEAIPKIGLFEQEDYAFLEAEAVSRKKYDSYVFIAKDAKDKLSTLIKVILHTAKNGKKADPFLVLCNNHEEVYIYQKALEEQIAANRKLREALVGTQTSGLGSVKSLDANGKMVAMDEKAYNELRGKLDDRSVEDRRKPLNQRIIEQASFAGVITFGTIGNNSRGTDIKKHKRELYTVVFGCSSDVLTPSSLVQALGRTLGRFKGRAGVIISEGELSQELQKFVYISAVLPKHFYQLINMVAANHTITREKNKIFNTIWETIQNAFHARIDSKESATKIANMLIKLHKKLYQQWVSAGDEDRKSDIFLANALKQLDKDVITQEAEKAIIEEVILHNCDIFVPNMTKEALFELPEGMDVLRRKDKEFIAAKAREAEAKAKDALAKAEAKEARARMTCAEAEAEVALTAATFDIEVGAVVVADKARSEAQATEYVAEAKVVEAKAAEAFVRAKIAYAEAAVAAAKIDEDMATAALYAAIGPMIAEYKSIINPKVEYTLPLLLFTVLSSVTPNSYLRCAALVASIACGSVQRMFLVSDKKDKPAQSDENLKYTQELDKYSSKIGTTTAVFSIGTQILLSSFLRRGLEIYMDHNSSSTMHLAITSVSTAISVGITTYVSDYMKSNLYYKIIVDRIESKEITER